MTDDLPTPCRPVHLLPSSVQYFSGWHALFHLVFGRPLFVFLDMAILNAPPSMCSSSPFIMCPYQFNRLSVIVLETCTTLVVPLMCSFLILSLRVTLHIYRSILISLLAVVVRAITSGRYRGTPSHQADTGERHHIRPIPGNAIVVYLLSASLSGPDS